MTPDSHEAGRGVRDQIERYRTAFLAVVTMIVIAAAVGGYILAHERVSLPAWVPVLGREHFTLKGEFSTGESITPGQGQSVTIAGAKVGEIASVDLHQGVALVTMTITPRYAKYIYRNATMLMRPKTQVKDMVVEVDPGSPSSGKVRPGDVIPLSQTAPDVNLDEFLASLDGETRAYLQELLAAAAQGLGPNGPQLASAFKRFDPTARLATEITKELKFREVNIRRGIHNFQLLLSALGDKNQALTDVIDSSNAVFRVFAEESQSVQSTLQLLPGALKATKEGLGKLTTAANVAGPTLTKLLPFAHELAPAEEAIRPFLRTTTPIFKNEIRPFAREVLPVVNHIAPATTNLAEAIPDAEAGFSVFNEFFNEIAYNGNSGRGNFLFFLDWANHNFNSVLSSADADSTLGHTLLYFNCEVTPLLEGAAKVNHQVNLILGLLKPPTPSECKAHGLSVSAAAARAKASAHDAAARANQRFAKLAQDLFAGQAKLLPATIGKGD
jgi:phospholipid/cholesterol/gamma-HCH transport system substrate-binding protein